MSDYIRREDASNWLKQYGQDVLHGKYKFSLMYIWKNIMDLPAADVVQVVRCGKCRYCTNNWHSSVYDLCKITGRNVIDTDFCNYGKKREE